MAGQQRVYRQRIRSTQSLKKIFRAMELIAASRIGKARARVDAASPYARAITRAVSAVATHADVDHPLTTERAELRRAAVLIVTADRGMAGAYSASVLREAERLLDQLVEEGKEPVLYVTGRRGVSYFSFRHRETARHWTGSSDAPTLETAREVVDTLLAAFLSEGDDAVGELHVVYTQFVNMVSQTPRVVRMLPLEVVEGVAEVGTEPLPLYEFEPSADVVLDALLPRYVQSRIYSFLLQAAASELASRQRAMHTATENAEELIRTFTRLANQARQAEITQEISEIVSGADALASS
ncbi:ATP synthase F0F1 subunit gamma [Actinotalea ferrariae CF5-4]|uniref:ATP synthase gamma chain n=1 Tax=Actinotalea ferrariae CF5-4 TaxID=948458 RepID=A0A021VQZ6_9CELL|nr:F0F1 ATP synthase subunit gamma [Actinotalea ferrariae]EYR63548.1 ATP synthase F0F1 subunit gamma [Actinotalea ferrariae CF5-4]